MSQSKQSLKNSSGESQTEVQEGLDRANAFVRQHGDKIWSIIEFVSHGEEWGGDLYQDFYLSLIKKPLPDSIRNMEKYLFRTLVNRAKGVKRREKRRREKIQYIYEQTDADEFVSADTAESVAKNEEVARILQLAKPLLGQREYEVIHLRFYEGRSNQDIGRLLNVKANSIARYLSSGIGKLRKLSALDERG